MTNLPLRRATESHPASDIVLPDITRTRQALDLADHRWAGGHRLETGDLVLSLGREQLLVRADGGLASFGAVPVRVSAW